MQRMLGYPASVQIDVPDKGTKIRDVWNRAVEPGGQTVFRGAPIGVRAIARARARLARRGLCGGFWATDGAILIRARESNAPPRS